MTEEKLLRDQELREEAELRAQRGGTIRVAAEASKEKLRWRKVLAVEMVNGWHANSHMWSVVKRAWLAIGKEPATSEEMYYTPANMMGVKRIYSGDRVTVFVAKNFKALNDALWDGRKTDVCIVLAERSMGVGKGMGTDFYKGARSGDKRRDWNIVK